MTFKTIVFAAALTAVAGFTQAGERVISIGGAVTEIVYALGEQHRLVARDTTSSFPEVAEDLPDVGYMRRLSPEGVLSLNPDLILASEGSGPPETVALLEAASIDYVVIPDDPSAEGIAEKIRAIGAALGVSDKAEALATDVLDRIAAAQGTAGAIDGNARVLFVLSTQNGRVLASGTNTAASAVIEMAGGTNAMTEFEGYKPLTDEAILAAAPDVILAMDRGENHDTATESLMGVPALAVTPAGQNGRIVHMDGLYLLGFGPRTADAVLDLNKAIYGS
ncbi:MAG: ABC transporter substrate-binding protein [Pseudomonadota bacterium]